MYIVHHVLKGSQRIVEAIYQNLEGEMDFMTLQETLWKEDLLP